MTQHDAVTVVLRECGERTASRSFEILQGIFDPSSVFRVREIPFSRALAASFRLGTSEKRPWTLCIDADVLVTAEGVSALLAETKRLPRGAFELQGCVFDKFFGLSRPGGAKLYRSALLADALELIPREGESLRPESDALRAMARRGYIWKQTRTVVGAHDFEQFHHDIYRKCFLQARKHAQHTSHFDRLWEELSEDDDDFRVAHAALRAGVSFEDAVLVSKDFRASQTRDALRALGIEEKPPLRAPCSAGELVEAFVARLSPEQRERTRKLEPETYPVEQHRPVRAWRRRLRSRINALTRRSERV